MKFRTTHLHSLIGTAAALGAASAFGAHSVTTGLTAEQMVGLLIEPGSGITVIPGSESYTGAPNASGNFFDATASTGLPFASGLLMTSGDATLSIGPNDLDDSTGANGLGGSSLLEAITGISNTLDATLLSFRFKSASDAFSFQYVFASEEYNEYVNSAFNDVFAFILTDSSGASVNVATLSAGIPVSINNVNVGSFSEYYRNNDLDNVPAPSLLDIEYDGLVGVNPGFALFATGSLIPNTEYTFTLAIADTSDRSLDSGVFIGGGTFTDHPPEQFIPESGTFLGAGALVALTGGAFLRRRYNRH